MLSIYRRHRAGCKFADDRMSKKCRCTVWATGTLEGKPYRKSLKTRSWERAEHLKRGLEHGPRPKEPPKSLAVSEACEAYLADCKSRQLSPRTLSKYRTLRTRFEDYSALRGILSLREWSQEHADDFRATWKGAGRTLSKTLEFARVMARFWHDRGWIERNWFKAMKPPKVKDAPRLPFTDEEVRKITAQAKDDRELAFILTLRHTGLRIGDASLLRVPSLHGDRIVLYTTKAGTPVSVIIPPALVSLLKALPAPGGYFFLVGESTHPHTASDLWRKRFKRMCKEAKISPPHPHRLRHYAASRTMPHVEVPPAIHGHFSNDAAA